MDDEELDEIEREVSAILSEQGVAWIEEDVAMLVAEDPERIEAPSGVDGAYERRVARLLLLLEAVQRTTQTVVACDLELLAAQARHDQPEPWRFANEEGELLPIVDPQRVDAAESRLQAVRALGQAVASLQTELAGELDGMRTLIEYRADKVVETRLREETDVTRLWSDTPELRYVVDPPKEEG